eukprot:10289858-Alexandrium_andersonii.AAC.1
MREANSPPQEPFRPLLGLPPDGHRSMDENACAPRCPVRALSRMVWHESGGGHRRTLTGLWR